MATHKLSLADEAVITDLLAKNARLEEEIEYLHNEIVSMKTGPYSDLLKENRKLRHELAVLVHGVDAESERLRGQLATVTKERDELVADAKRYRWLRDKLFLDGDLEETTIDVSSVWEFGTFLSVDKFIDAALAKLGAGKGV